jgi:hypothetical protein
VAPAVWLWPLRLLTDASLPPPLQMRVEYPDLSIEVLQVRAGHGQRPQPAGACPLSRSDAWLQPGLAQAGLAAGCQAAPSAPHPALGWLTNARLCRKQRAQRISTQLGTRSSLSYHPSPSPTPPAPTLQVGVSDANHVFVSWEGAGTNLAAGTSGHQPSHHESHLAGVDILTFNKDRSRILEVRAARGPERGGLAGRCVRRAARPARRSRMLQ